MNVITKEKRKPGKKNIIKEAKMIDGRKNKLQEKENEGKKIIVTNI